MTSAFSRLRGLCAGLAGVATTAGFLVIGPVAASATSGTITTTYGFTNTVQHFLVPSGVTSITLTALGGKGSWGGADASGSPPAGGYQGEVTGTISVTPGEYLTIAVGAGGNDPVHLGCTGGADSTSPGDPSEAVGGVNPLSQYDGGKGGAPGSQGCSGYGGSGGAATVIEIGSSASSPTDVGTIVAAGGGGDGGSGQFTLVRGQIGLGSYVAQSTPTKVTYTLNGSSTSIYSPSPLPANATQGQDGTSVFTMCGGGNANQYFSTGATSCDGGGGAGGGGGAAGGGAGSVQFGSGSSNEWYGQGGSPGQNSTAGLAGLTSLYSYYSDYNPNAGTAGAFVDPGAQYDGSVSLSYSSGVPGAPTAVSGSADNSGVALEWTPPASSGAASISDYVVQYSSDGGTTWTSDDTNSTDTSATVSGLTNGTGYIFQVEAVNSYGAGPYSASSGTVTPSGPPGAPAITSVGSQDGALKVGFTAPASVAPITGYLYQLNGTGPWLSASGTTSPLTIAGLADGTSYSVAIEAVNLAGAGPASNSMSGTPAALPGAPTITSVQVGPGTASVAFSPGNTGGAPITGYRYSLDGGTTWTATAGPSPIAVSALAAGTTYSFRLEAVNSTGNGTAATAAFTTPTAPTAPVITSVQPGNQILLAQFPAPSAGGYPVTDFRWSTDGGATWASESAHGALCRTSTDGTTDTCLVDALSSDGTTPLANGTTYPLEFEAVNAVGASGPSVPVDGTPATTPGAPAITTGSDGMVAANQALTVSFNAPGDDGGSTITAYQYSTDAGVTWHDRTDGLAATASPMTITALSSDGATALVNGVTYYVEIRGVNQMGAGPGSAVATGIPATAPVAPTIDSVSGHGGGLTVAFTPGSNGGAAVTGYLYSLDGGHTWVDTGSVAPGFTVNGLTDGTPYQVQVEAVNSVGTSEPSAPAAGTPVEAPTQPSIVSTARGNGTITVTFSQSSDGGSPITSYQYSTDAGATWFPATSTVSPVTISALSTNGTTPVANGTEYPVEIRAVNAQGTSLPSNPIEVAPATVPAAPNVTLAPGNGAIAVTAAVTDDGGAPVTGMDYSLNGGPFVSTGTSASTFTISGLTNGTSYTVSVRADNAIGAGVPSPSGSTEPSTVPGAPTGVVATGDATSAVVSWIAPESDGGSPVVSYTATAYTTSGGTTVAGTPCTTTALFCTVTGLTNGTTYFVGVVATNADGAGPVSNPLQAVTPLARPSAPTIGTITPGNTFLSVPFTAGSPGGKPITAYQYSLEGGTTWATASGTASPIVISGLTNGTSYSVVLRAVSAVGVGAASSPVSATPANYPDPVNAATIFANGESGQAVITWTVPYSGGSAITQAQATAFTLASGGTQAQTCTTTANLTTGSTATCTLTGLTNGTTYYISIQSDNAVGWSSRSNPRVAVTPSVNPGAVSNLVATAGNTQAVLTWAPGSQGASAINDYTVSYSSNGGSTWTPIDTHSTATSATVTNLTNGTAYVFEVYASNSNGTGPASAPSNSVTPHAPISVTSSPLADGEVGVAYDQNPTISGGTGTITWSVASGTLPPGLTIVSSTGEVEGTPTVSGTYIFTIQAADGYTDQSSQSETVSISPGPALTSPPLAGGELGVAYLAQPAASGGIGGYTWSVSGGTLPPGLTLDASSGQVSGTPTAAGTYNFKLVVTDGNAQSASQPESVTVVGSPTVSATFPDGPLAVAYYVAPTVEGGTAPYTWSVTGSLAPGLALNHSTGVISGTPTAAGAYSFVLVVTDHLGVRATLPVSMTIQSVETGGRVTATPSGTGYWVLGQGGAVSVHGLAVNYGTMPGGTADPVVGMTANTLGTGYWQTTASGKVSPFGQAGFFGSASGIKLDQPIVAITHTPDDHGYWLAGADGGVFGYGDARFYGSMGGTKLNRHIVGIASTPDGRGYWLVAADGGVFSFGDARFYGSMGGTKLTQPVVGMAVTPDGRGYWLVAADGGVFTFGDARYFGSKAGRGAQVVGIIAYADHGYRLIGPNGAAYNFGSV